MIRLIYFNWLVFLIGLICGLIVFVMPSNAQPLPIEELLLTLRNLDATPSGNAFLRQFQLPGSPTANDFLATINKLPSSESTEIFNLLNEYHNGMADPNGHDLPATAYILENNETLARRIFSINNQPIELANILAKYSTRQGTNEAATGGSDIEINFDKIQACANGLKAAFKMSDEATPFSILNGSSIVGSRTIIAHLIDDGHLIIGSC